MVGEVHFLFDTYVQIKASNLFDSVVGVLRPRRFKRIHFQELRTTFVFVSSDVVWFVHLHSQRQCGGGFHGLAKAGGLCQSACEYSELRSGPELRFRQTYKYCSIDLHLFHIPLLTLTPNPHPLCL